MHQESSPLCKNRNWLALIVATSIAVSSGAPAAATPGNHAATAEAKKTTKTVTDEQPPSKPLSAGTLELEEYKKTQTIEVNVSQSKLFLIKSKIVRTSVADPGIAEPVVVAENAIILLGKAPGETTLQLWDNLGCEVHINVLVGHNRGPLSSLFDKVHTALVEHMETKRNRHSKVPPSPGKLELKACLDPRNSRDSGYQEQTANELQLLSKIQTNGSVKPSLCSNTKTQQSTSPSAPAGHYSKTSQDTVSLPGGKKVVLESGFKTGKTTKIFDLTVSQSRTFKSKTRLVKFVTTDPRIAEPMPLSVNEFILEGKAPGRTQLEMLDEFGNTLAIDIRVEKPLGVTFARILMFSDLLAKRSHGGKQPPILPAVMVNSLVLFEQKPSKPIVLEPYQPKFYNSNHALVRTAVADPGHVEPVLVSATQLAFVGKMPGSTTVFLWDDAGNIGVLKLQVNDTMASRREATKPTKPNTLLTETGPQSSLSSQGMLGSQAVASKQDISATQEAPAGKTKSLSGSVESGSKHECETWTGSRKDVISVSLGKDINCSNSTTTFTEGDQLIALNNEGVKAINGFDYAQAIEQLEKALKLDYTYKTARENLAITYNNFGLSLQDKPSEAISYFHHAVYLDANNLTSKQNLEGIIRKLGKDPDSFDDRLMLGDEAVRKHDTRGGIIEYQAALNLKDDPAVRAKLAEAVKTLEKSGRQHL